MPRVLSGLPLSRGLNDPSDSILFFTIVARDAWVILLGPRVVVGGSIERSPMGAMIFGGGLHPESWERSRDGSRRSGIQKAKSD